MYNKKNSSLLIPHVDEIGHWLAPLGLRVILAWEFFESGLEKLMGSNWFADLGDKFPLPFSLLGADINWALATWVELVGSVALLLGLGTRYIAYTFWILTIVATFAVHWPADWSSLGELWQGYAISNKGFGNYKLPLLYLVMLLPLILSGAGRFSLDALLGTDRMPIRGGSVASGWGVVLIALGWPLALLLPWAGSSLVVAGAMLLFSGLRGRF